MSVRLAALRSSTADTTSAPSRSDVKYRTPLLTSRWYSACPDAILNAGEVAGPTRIRYVPARRTDEKFSSYTAR